MDEVMGSTSGVTQAAVQLAGSILQLDVVANSANLALEMMNLPVLDERRLRKSIQGQITQAVRGLNSAKRADIEAAQTAVEETLKAFKVTETALRASADSARLRRYIIASNPRPLALISEDPAAEHCFHSIMTAAVDRITKELRSSRSAVGPLLLEAHDLIAGLDKKAVGLESRYKSILKDVELIGQQSTHNEDQVGEFIDGLRMLKGLDYRPSCRKYIGSPGNFDRIDNLLPSNGIVSVWGPPLSGRFELLRQWCRRAGKQDVTSKKAASPT
jgi:hypothetical protein